MTGSSNVRILNVVKIAGVFIAWAIGSGSVTGQASLHFSVSDIRCSLKILLPYTHISAVKR